MGSKARCDCSSEVEEVGTNEFHEECKNLLGIMRLTSTIEIIRTGQLQNEAHDMRRESKTQQGKTLNIELNSSMPCRREKSTLAG